MIFQSDESVQVCPTGSTCIANITLQSFLNIPIYDETKEMTPPHGTSGDFFFSKTNHNGLEVLLVDERSLIGRGGGGGGGGGGAGGG